MPKKLKVCPTCGRREEPKKRFVHACSKCGMKDEIEDYRLHVKHMEGIAHEPCPDKIQFLCFDCVMKQFDWVRKKYGGPTTNYTIAHKLMEVGLPPTLKNIRWYCKALITAKGE